MRTGRYLYVVKLAGFVACSLLLAAGCGYTTRSLIASKYHTVYVPPFTSSIDTTREEDVGNRYKIYRPGLETDITKSIISKFLFDGNVKPGGMETSDLELKGQLIEFRRDPLRYTANDDVEENKAIWEEKNFTGDTTYFPAQKSEDAAIKDALSDLARRIVARVVEEW
jgi:hypothetical protein